jgi:Putative MetA-pathway of phenol degradation
MQGCRRLVCTLASIAMTASTAPAQDMEPRAYSASPVGANFLVGSYSRSEGAVLFDETLPVRDVQATVQGFVVALGHSFNSFGKLSMLTVAQPYAVATASGQVFEQLHEVRRSGLADTRIKYSINLRGNPAMSPREFARAPRRTIVGASLTAIVPAGQYYPDKLINLSANRWAWRPEIGIAIPRGRWEIDGYFGVWLYADNPDFFPGGARKAQDALFSSQAHVSYTIKPRLWLAANSTWYRGGSSRVDDGESSTLLNNSRAGVTLSLPVGRRYSAKVAFGHGVVARTGTDFTTVAVAWQALWLSPRWSGR